MEQSCTQRFLERALQGFHTIRAQLLVPNMISGLKIVNNKISSKVNVAVFQINLAFYVLPADIYLITRYNMRK